jgi:hypothetical protein
MTRAARPRICPTCKTPSVVARYTDPFGRPGHMERRACACKCTVGLICGSPGAAILSWERAERNKRDPVGERRKRARNERTKET